MKLTYKLNLICISIRHKLANLFNTRLAAISSIEMILLLLVLVSIIVIFRSQITSIVTGIFSKIREQINDF